MSTTLPQIAIQIIKEQELIIGPLAWSEAKKVKGLEVDTNIEKVNLNGENKKEIIDLLVNRYSMLFGEASKAVCKSAVQHIISTLPEQDIPTSLR